MPLKAASPKVISEVKGDVFTVTKITFDLGSDTMMVSYDVGSVQVDATVKMVASNQSFTVALNPLKTTKPVNTKTWEQQIKELVYKVGQDAGVFPAGVVS